VHSRIRLAASNAASALLIAFAFEAAVTCYQPSSAQTPTASEIGRALEKVKADPNLATEKTIKTLRWKNVRDPKPANRPRWFAWILNLFVWIGESARVLIWGSAIALVAWLIVYIVRTVRKQGTAPEPEHGAAPTHVRDLDIRPETLPSDIGAAARALWDAGEHRAALALLYRGMLSRLAHVHRVPIRDSTTEGDCLQLAAIHLTQRKREYTSRVVRVWQRFVYGGEKIQAAIVYALFDEFAAALDSASMFDSVHRGGAA
jgi:Domain of unknown function (DUF4129)